MRPSPSSLLSTGFFSLLAYCAFACLPISHAHADESPAEPLILLSASGAAQQATPSSAQVTTKPPAQGQGVLEVTITPGKESYPGINIKPPAATWDLSKFGHVEARVTNTGAKAVQLSLRIDCDDDPSRNPWNAEFESIASGQTKTVRVRFGYSFGKRGYKLNPARASRILVYGGKSTVEQSFRIESVAAGGQPGEKPIRPPGPVLSVPKDGVLLGAGVTIDLAKQIEAKGGVTAEVAEGLRITFADGAKEDAAVRIKPPAGRWDLRAYTQVTVRAKNIGTAPLTLRARLESQPGSNEWIASPNPIAPGAVGEIVLPFAGSSLWTGVSKSGPQFASEQTTAIAIAAAGSTKARSLMIESIRAARPIAKTPDWLGKRPPVEGKWAQTLDENFDGPAIDKSRWAVVGENYYDSSSHFSPGNAFIENGMAHLRFEAKRGRQNDDPKRPETDYATGFLTGHGKWTQRYGYFESRMKLPAAQGLWPAFWMMPDRGAGAANRGTTSKGGMEFDIMEYLSRYGPNRYNIAMHWDDYGKDHKSTGTENIYAAPDADGFITAGMLWEPGKLTFYCNGTKVAEWENPRVANVPAFIMYTFPSGGWGGNERAEDDAGLPADFVIDWVRAWQRDDLAALPPADPAAPAAPAKK